MWELGVRRRVLAVGLDCVQIPWRHWRADQLRTVIPLAFTGLGEDFVTLAMHFQ